jgi:DNA end-binding protein Ku
MAARSIGSLTISFGLVAIPVKLYSSRQSAGGHVSFNLLHEKCGSRLRQQYICAREGVVVPREEMIKGFEFAKDQYVTFKPEEIKALEAVGTHSIDVEEFVPMESIDPIYFDATYYLAPDKGGSKPYALFARALAETQRFAVGRWATRGQQHIVALRPVEQVLVLQQLLFAAELRSPKEIELDRVEVREPELKLARQLIEQQSSAGFDPNAYHDDVKERVEAEIQKKVEGKEISISEEQPQQSAKVIDLMEALRASLEKTGGRGAEGARLGARKPPRKVARAPARSQRATRKS